MLACKVAGDGDRDGLPNVIVEAMAMKVPVITTSACVAEEVVTDGEQGHIVEPGKPEELAARIADIMANRSKRDDMGSQGRELVAREFDISRNIGRLVALFEGVTSLENDTRPAA